jgi:hypothetical protein
MNPIDLSHWVTQLTAQCPAFSGRFIKCIPDDDIKIYAQQSPIAFIYESSDQSDQNRLNTGTRQRTTITVTIEIIFRRQLSLLDQFDSGAADLLRQYRREIGTALVGWKPQDAIKAVVHSNGALKSKDKRLIKWVDNYTTDIITEGFV